MLFRRSLIMCAVLAGTVGTSGAVLAAAASSAASVVLHKSEVPAGYALKSQAYTNAGMQALTKIPKAQFDQHGRVTGLLEAFTKGSSAIESFASQYKSTSGAVWEYGKSVAADLKSTKITSAPKVGDRSTGYTATGTLKGVAVVEYGVDFQKGDYNMTAQVIGPKGTVSLSSAVHYAKIMAGRA